MNDIITAIRNAGALDFLNSILPFIWLSLGISTGVGVALFLMNIFSDLAGRIHLNLTKKSTADDYWSAVQRGDKQAMARIARQDSLEQRGLR